MKKLFFPPVSFILLLILSACTQTHWTNLFNGRDLKGWTQKGGSASYKAVDGAIVATTVLNSPNSFLCTEKNFGDFILEMDFKVDSSLNSGVQVRSESFPEYQDGRVHGYQVEIDPSRRAFSGGIYDESRRGWLVPLNDNEAARKAFRQGDWNLLRIEAIADTIRVWINGTPSAWLIDNLTHSGFIGLQVHSIGNDSSKLGIQVRFKNIRICTENPAAYAHKGDMSISQVNMIPNTVSAWEKIRGWKLLFDGQSTNGWRGAYLDNFPEKGWIVKNGILSVLSSGGAEAANGGDIVTLNEYANFELTLEYKLTMGANSGIKYFVTENEQTKGSAIGLEYQLLDDANHPDAKLGNHEGSRVNAALYDLIKPVNKRENALGEWNCARIVSRNNHIEHWLNGFKVLEYERGSAEFRKLVGESKYKIWPGFGEALKGHILLQDHGDEVSFRSIKLREL